MQKNKIKKLFKIFTVFAVLLFSACKEELILVFEISGEDFSVINSGEARHDILILDVRNYGQYKLGHIRHAVSMPADQLARRLHEISSYAHRPVYVYADSVDTSRDSVIFLIENGFSQVTNVEGLRFFDYGLAHYESITPYQFFEFIQSDDVLLIDYRLKFAYEFEHIKNALHVEYGQMEHIAKQLPKDIPIIVYSDMGSSAAEGAQTLAMLGFQSVYACIEGLREYPYPRISNAITTGGI